MDSHCRTFLILQNHELIAFTDSSSVSSCSKSIRGMRTGDNRENRGVLASGQPLRNPIANANPDAAPARARIQPGTSSTLAPHSLETNRHKPNSLGFLERMAKSQIDTTVPPPPKATPVNSTVSPTIKAAMCQKRTLTTSQTASSGPAILTRHQNVFSEFKGILLTR